MVLLTHAASHAVAHGDNRSDRHRRASRGTPPPPLEVIRTRRPASLPPDSVPRDPQEQFREELAELIRNARDARFTACYALVLAIHERQRSTGIGSTDDNFTKLVELKTRIGTPGSEGLIKVNDLWALVTHKLHARDQDSVIALIEAFIAAVRPSTRLRAVLEAERSSIARALRNAKTGEDRQRVTANVFDRMRTKL
jgi:hypothetical protein